MTGESAIKPEYVGNGMLMLEPTYKYILLEDVGSWGGGLVLEDGMFLACESSVKRSVVAFFPLLNCIVFYQIAVYQKLCFANSYIYLILTLLILIALSFVFLENTTLQNREKFLQMPGRDWFSLWNQKDIVREHLTRQSEAAITPLLL